MKKHKGFTLIELIVVITIMGILAAIAIPYYGNSVKEAKVAAIEHNTIVARRYINNVVVIHNVSNLKEDSATPVTISEIIDSLSAGNKAPGGGDAYGTTPDTSTGRIGISTTSTGSSTTKHPANSTFTITPPTPYAGKTFSPVVFSPL